MKTKLNEILVIMQEEAAEVIQEVSKCFRFGLKPNNKEKLEKEIADFLVMVDLLKEEGVISNDGLELGKKEKIEKLRMWSNIYSN